MGCLNSVILRKCVSVLSFYFYLAQGILSHPVQMCVFPVSLQIYNHAVAFVESSQCSSVVYACVGMCEVLKYPWLSLMMNKCIPHPSYFLSHISFRLVFHIPHWLLLHNY